MSQVRKVMTLSKARILGDVAEAAFQLANGLRDIHSTQDMTVRQVTKPNGLLSWEGKATVTLSNGYVLEFTVKPG